MKECPECGTVLVESMRLTITDEDGFKSLPCWVCPSKGCAYNILKVELDD